MENLLAMPVRPLEVMLGKIVPYVVLGYVQVRLILVMARSVFGVPMRGSVLLLLMALGVFIACNLAVGFTFSTMARTQLQAQQMAHSSSCCRRSCCRVHVPVPAACRPGRSAIGEVLPLTHVLRIVPRHPAEGQRTCRRSRRISGRWRCSPSWRASLRCIRTARRWIDVGLRLKLRVMASKVNSPGRVGSAGEALNPNARRSDIANSPQ